MDADRHSPHGRLALAPAAAWPGETGAVRPMRYLRLGVTDHCNMACVYCMPEGYRGSPRAAVLQVDEIIRVVRAFWALGVRTVRFTGGEPLVRHDLVELVGGLHAALPRLDLALTTNGALLPRLAAPLRRAGLGRLNISVDSTDPQVFHTMTRGGRWQDVQDGIHAAHAAGFTDLKTNTVVMRRHNLAHLAEIAAWVRAHGMTPRFIELMPLGEGAALMGEHVPLAEMQAALAPLLEPGGAPHRPPLRGPAFYLPLRDGGAVGFVAAVSQRFCDTCDRVRLSAAGELRPCLARDAGVSLRTLLRDGAADGDLVACIQRVMSVPAGHAFSSDAGASACVVMTGIGG